MDNYARQSDAVRLAQFTPEETADMAANDGRITAVRRDIEAALANEPDPQKRAALQQAFDAAYVDSPSPATPQPLSYTPNVEPASNDGEYTIDAYNKMFGGQDDGTKRGFANAFGRQFKVSFQQLPQLAYGVGALGAATIEHFAGPGGLATAAKQWAVDGYKNAEQLIANTQADNQEWDKALDKAKSGDFGALVDWFGGTLGYVVGQTTQMLATAGVGTLAGKVVGRAAVEKIAGDMVLSEAAKIGATEAGKAMAKDEIRRLAVQRVAGDIGQKAAMAAAAFGMEGGEIGGDLVSANKDRVLSGNELTRAYAATLLAGGLEYAGDRLGLKSLEGKVGGAMGSRAAKAATGGAISAAGEAGTEYAQTLAEEWGKGNDPTSDESFRQAQNAAMMGAVGGATHGVVGGVIHPPEKKPELTPAQQATVDAANTAAQHDPQAREAAARLAAVDTKTDPDPVGAMIAAASDMARRPVDDLAGQFKKIGEGAAIEQMIDSPEYKAKEEARLSKLAEAIDVHTALVEDAAKKMPLSPQPNGTQSFTGGVVPQPVADHLATELPARVTSGAVPELNQTPLMKGRYSGPLAEQAVNADRAAAGLPPTPTSLTSMPQGERAARIVDPTPITNIDEARRNLATMRERAPEFGVNPNDMVLVPHPDVPGATAVGVAYNRTGTNTAPQLRERPTSAPDNVTYPEREQPISASAPNKYKGNTRFADLTPMSRQQAEARLEVLQESAQRKGNDPQALQIVPHPGSAGKFAIKNMTPPQPKLSTQQRASADQGMSAKAPVVVDPVTGYITAKRKEATPAAQAFVRAYDKGELSREDVLRAIAADNKSRTDAQLHTEAAGLVAPEAPMKTRGEAVAREGEVARTLPGEQNNPPIGTLGKEPEGEEVEKAKAAAAKPPEPGVETGTTAGREEGAKKLTPEEEKKLHVNNNSAKLAHVAKAKDMEGAIKLLEGDHSPLIKRVAELARQHLLGKTKLRHGGHSSTARGSYTPGTDTVTIFTPGEKRLQTLAHEFVHALTAHAIISPTTQQKVYVQRLEVLRKHIRDVMGEREYERYMPQRQNYLHEFAVEVFTNAGLQKRLSEIPYQNKSAWTKFVEFVAGLLGFNNKSNALTEGLATLENLIALGRQTQRGMADSITLSDTAQDEKLSAASPAEKAQNTVYAPDPSSQGYADVLAQRLTNRARQLDPGADPVVLKAVKPATAVQRGVEAVANRLFGKPVVFVQFGGKPLFNGAQLANSVYLNVDADRPLMAILGHELLHTLRHAQPKLYEQLHNRLAGIMKAGGYADQINEKRTKAGLPTILDTDTITEELIADITGDNFVDPEFWKAMAAEQPKGFKGLADTIIKWLDGLIEKLTSSRPFGTERYVTDLNTARSAVVDAMRQLSGAEVGAVTDNVDVKFSPPAKSQAEEVTARTDFTPEQRAALIKLTGAADTRDAKTKARETVKKWTTNLRERAVQAVVDQYAPIKRFSQAAYMKARMQSGSDGALEASLVYGKLHVRDDGSLDVAFDPKKGGFVNVMAKLQGEHQTFFHWVAGLRAEELMKQSRENLLTAEDITALKSLDEGKMPDGTSRKEAYAEALRELNDYNDSILKVAVERGLIAEEARQYFKDHPYVPFYRQLEEDGVQTPHYSSALTGQVSWKRLLGGTSFLHEDLMTNVLRNWSHMLEASAKNDAAVATLQAAEEAGAATRVETRETGSVKVLIDGKPAYFMIHDAPLAQALSAMHYVMPDWMKPLQGFKRILTSGVTTLPDFKLRNLLRDTPQTLAASDISTNMVKNVAQGLEAADFKQSLKNLMMAATGKHPKSFMPQTQSFASALASGAVMRFGTRFEGDRAHHVENMVRRARATVTLDAKNAEKFMHYLSDLGMAYHEAGDASEQANRLALYEQMKAKGYSNAEAAFMARDLMDFSMSGKAPVVRFLIQTVPFMNARLQGLYKLGRAATSGDRYKVGNVELLNKRFTNVAGSVVLASLALMLAYQNDPDWKKREDYERDGWWWFKVGDIAFRIPKPFELGSVGTLAERTWELFANDEMTVRRYGDRISNMLLQTFALDPFPQAIKPLIDIYANKDSFTGRSIENTSDENLRPEDRYDDNTSMVARFLGSMGLPSPMELMKGRYAGLSPKQIDHLMQGYFGTLGVTLSGMVDLAAKPAVAAEPATRPFLEGTVGKMLTAGLLKDLPSDQSRYVQALYDRAKEVEQTYASYQHAINVLGDRDKAMSILADNRELLMQREMVAEAKRRLTEINKRIQQVNASVTLTGDAKERLLKMLKQQKGAVSERVEAGLPAY